ncbi:hypothetical protein BD410DRAFT_846029 [Rickenella mellea]|uniref:RlpA-like protein double-psi beta-barrel domain-containing protein n=1 Tax=Rickenella mellea TaxID=50990 RepID=A0A4Y7PGL5_9AGAM|nr:hypothetical protein BD410DRAFT_846029 [Rickenella mellea]
MVRMTVQLIALCSLVFASTATAAAVPSKRQANGRATWYNPEGFGFCGTRQDSSQHIVAISSYWTAGFGTGVCGVQINAWTPDGRSTTATITDVCYTCGQNDIDFSPAAFQDLAPLSSSPISIEWQLL